MEQGERSKSPTLCNQGENTGSDFRGRIIQSVSIIWIWSWEKGCGLRCPLEALAFREWSMLRCTWGVPERGKAERGWSWGKPWGAPGLQRAWEGPARVAGEKSWASGVKGKGRDYSKRKEAVISVDLLWKPQHDDEWKRKLDLATRRWLLALVRIVLLERRGRYLNKIPFIVKSFKKIH